MTWYCTAVTEAEHKSGVKLLWVSYGVSVMRIWEKIDRVIMSWHCWWVESYGCSCLVTWFCYQLIAKPDNKAAASSWPDPCMGSTLGEGVEIPVNETNWSSGNRTSTARFLWALISHFWWCPSCCISLQCVIDLTKVMRSCFQYRPLLSTKHSQWLNLCVKSSISKISVTSGVLSPIPRESNSQKKSKVHWG